MAEQYAENDHTPRRRDQRVTPSTGMAEAALRLHSVYPPGQRP